MVMKLFKLLVLAFLVDSKMNLKLYHPVVTETEATHSIESHLQKLKRKLPKYRKKIMNSQTKDKFLEIRDASSTCAELLEEHSNEPELELTCLSIIFNNDYFWLWNWPLYTENKVSLHVKNFNYAQKTL